MMSLHKLTAGDGYTYLTRQVAAQDATERGYSSLGDYYAGKGESPGIWTGGGIASLGIDGQVTEQQMKNLFGAGLHPDADRLEAEAIAALPGTGRAVERVRSVNRAVRLGQPFLQTEVDTTWRDRLTAAYETWNTAHDNDPHHPIPAAAKEQIRTDLANQMFTERHGRPPADVAERTGFIAHMSRPSRTAVAGFDVTFSPVKSVSTLWAVAPPAISRQVEDAHHAAVTSTLSWLEKEAGYTRLGAHGPAQVPVRGLVMAQFTHRDSRADDPDLHTHVAISNKVQTLDGRWLALDARMLHRVAVAASEHYNTALEAEVTQRTGAVFADRGDLAGKRAVREIVGVDNRLNERWSSRRQRIVTSRTELAHQFLARHGRVPTTVEMIKLAQQATLDTREGKHEPRSLSEQRAAWTAEAIQILGSANDVRAMVERVVHAQRFPFEPITDELIQSLAARTVRAVAESRAHWRESNLAAEAQRQVRGAHLDPGAVLSVAEQVVARCVDSDLCVPIGIQNEVDAAIPEALLRADGTSMYTVAKGQLYTSVDIIGAEQRVVATAGRTGARTIDEHDVQIAALEWSANHDGHELNTAQAAMVTDIATSSRYLQLALAPAGTGKTTVMGVLASAWTGSGGNVLGLAPQASAAQELAAAIPGVDADTIDKLVHDITHTPKHQWARWIHAVNAESLVIIDEAGLASTPKLDAAISFIVGRRGRVLLVGDEQQRAAIGAGGLLRDIESTHGSLTLTEVLRFIDPLEGHASLALRAGDPGAVGYLADRGRVHAVTPDTAADTVFTRWASDIAAGADSVMIAPTLSMVTALNARARQARTAQLGDSAGPELQLPNGETVSEGDAIITKHNQRRLPMGSTDFVRNNYRWTIQTINPDGSITATEKTRGITRTLPTWYIQAGWVRLGYAHTHASVQGMTIGKAHTQPGTAHAVVTAAMTRNDLYPALTRAADGTHAYVILGGEGDNHDVTTPQAIQPATAIETLTAIIGTDGSARSVTTEQREAANPLTRLGPAVDAYIHALTVAAETTIGPDETMRIVAAAEEAVPGITDQPAWETLRGHLMIIVADGQDPIAALDVAATSRELGTARDTAAVLDFRLDPTGNHSQQPGPLPWIPQIPAALQSHPIWSTYLAARSDSIAQFADQIRGSAAAWTPHTAPTWALPYLGDHDFATELALWRASETIADSDLRPAGPTPRRIAMIRRHRDLTSQALNIGGDIRDGADRWAAVLAARGVDIVGDDYWPVLAPRLNLADTAGLHVHTLLDAATRQGPLPAEGAAAALWWRLAPHIGDLATGPTGGSHHLRPPWAADLATVLGHARAERIVHDRLWPVIVSRVDTLTREGNDPTRIVTGAAHMLARNADTVTDHEAPTVLLWNIGTLTDPEPLDPEALPTDPADDDLTAPVDAHALTYHARPDADRPLVQTAADDDAEPPETSWQEGATMTLAPLDTGADIHRPAASRALDDDQRDLDPTVIVQPGTSTGRLKEAIAAAHEFFTASAPQSWVPKYLASRRLDPLAAGYAPSGSHLVKHLRQRGFADTEMIDAGLARQSERGLYDFFRNRLTLPYHDNDGQIVGFMTRKPPTDTNDRNPKYLNSPDTAIFHKKQLPLDLDDRTVAALRAGTDVVLVEGPMDALAINTATDRKGLVAIATGGTALTPQHLQTLDSIAPLTERRVLVLMDNDLAGEAAAARAHETLTAAGLQDVLTTDPLPVKDASQMLEEQGPRELRYALDLRRPIEDLVVDRIQHVYASHQTPQQMEAAEVRLNMLFSTAPIVAEMNASQQNRQTLRLANNLRFKILTVFDEIERVRATMSAAPQFTEGLHLPAKPGLNALSPELSRSGNSRRTFPQLTNYQSITSDIEDRAVPTDRVVRPPETEL